MSRVQTWGGLRSRVYDDGLPIQLLTACRLITASAKFIVHSRQEQGWNLMHNSSKPSSAVPGFSSRLIGTKRRYRYRPTSNGSYPIHHQPSPTPGSQMMYSYRALPQQGQHQAQPMQHMSRPSPPQPTWAVPQTHNPYYQMPRGQDIRSREDNRHVLARPDVATSQSPTPNNITYSNSMHGPGTLSTTDYFPGVIDTSESRGMHIFSCSLADKYRSVGSEGLRRVGLISIVGPGCR
jgi:hypothetical protein